MAKRAGDLFVNRAIFSLTMSAANTITFEQVRFGLGVFTGTALIVHRVDWHLESAAELITAGDNMQLALTNREDLAALQAHNMNVLILKEVRLGASGTPANALLMELPLVSDLSTLPGGGLIIPANPLYVAMLTTGYAAAGVVHCVMWYTTKTLTDADWIELVQSLVPVNI